MVKVSLKGVSGLVSTAGRVGLIEGQANEVSDDLRALDITVNSNELVKSLQEIIECIFLNLNKSEVNKLRRSSRQYSTFSPEAVKSHMEKIRTVFFENIARLRESNPATLSELFGNDSFLPGCDQIEAFNRSLDILLENFKKLPIEEVTSKMLRDFLKASQISRRTLIITLIEHCIQKNDLVSLDHLEKIFMVLGKCEVYCAIGRCHIYLNLNKLDEAADALKKIGEPCTQKDWLLYNLAREFIGNRQINRALSLVPEASLRSRLVEYSYSFCENMLKEKRLDDLMDLIEQLPEESSKRKKAIILGLIQAYLKEENIEKTLNLMEKLPEVDRLEVLSDVVKIYIKRGSLDEALARIRSIPDQHRVKGLLFFEVCLKYLESGDLKSILPLIPCLMEKSHSDKILERFSTKYIESRDRACHEDNSEESVDKVLDLMEKPLSANKLNTLYHLTQDCITRNWLKTALLIIKRLPDGYDLKMLLMYTLCLQYIINNEFQVALELSAQLIDKRHKEAIALRISKAKGDS